MRRASRPGTIILSLDLHPQRYGYAVLETPENLLDWGVRRRHRSRQSRKTSDLRRSLQMLLQIWLPSLVLIRQPSTHRNVRTQKYWIGLLDEARRCHIRIRHTTDSEVRSAFGVPGATKYAIAQLLVKKFPFLASTLPPPRKIWCSEDYRMNILAAAATALAGSTKWTLKNR
jgi:hypothetical protein